MLYYPWSEEEHNHAGLKKGHGLELSKLSVFMRHCVVIACPRAIPTQ